MKPLIYALLFALCSLPLVAAHADYVETITTTTTTKAHPKNCDCTIHKVKKTKRPRQHYRPRNSYSAPACQVQCDDCYHCYRGECECYYRAHYPVYTNQFDYQPYYEEDYMALEYNVRASCRDSGSDWQ